MVEKLLKPENQSNNEKERFGKRKEIKEEKISRIKIRKKVNTRIKEKTERG